MSFFDRLERPLAKFAIPGLIRYVVALNALVFILVTLNPGYTQMLELNRQAILEGQVWRLVSWIFIPQTTSYFFIFFYLLVTWWLGDLLEQSWGTFRLNAYYLLGMVLCAASALIFGASEGTYFLNLSLFLAVATLAPNLEILLFFVIPVKIKWVAVASLILPGLVLLTGSLGEKMIVIMCLGNYLLFFAPGFWQMARQRRHQPVTVLRRVATAAPAEESLHRCHVCGLTEQADPSAEFRVSADGNEYCLAHLPKRS